MGKFAKSIILILGVCSLFFVGCNNKITETNTELKVETSNNSSNDDSNKYQTSQFVSITQSSVKESVKTTSPSVENAVESKQDDEDVQKNTQQDTQPDTQQEATEKEYYDLIKKAWQKQKDYIDSIDDPKVKQSVQTTHSAAILKSDELLLTHPEDSKSINASLKKVLAGE